MIKIPNFTRDHVESEKIQAAVKSALAEAGLLSDMVTRNQASKLLSVTIVTAGIRSGKLRITPKTARNCKRLIPLKDVIALKEALLKESEIKLKQ